MESNNRQSDRRRQSDSRSSSGRSSSGRSSNSGSWISRLYHSFGTMSSNLGHGDPVTVQSFNNLKNGTQVFNRANIQSPEIKNSFNNLGSGFQNLAGIVIKLPAHNTHNYRS
ncbi:unnamed protein product [Sphenostylis stenocarpa]|uniref:Uncharacterized protein n=1 Tax=Sphenostylis stenocarpa TaxID=92480 RepID=A0AA86S791_9FABA|nr:unnamed protein product [Sphenostylis stenocarpa]